MRPADAQLVFLKGILKYGKNDKAFQHLLDVDCIIKTKGSIPTQAVSHRRKNDGCVCRSVKLHVCKNSLSRIFQFVKINELYNIYIFPGIACKVEPGKVLYVWWNCSERCQLGLCNHCTVYGSHNPSQTDSSLHKHCHHCKDHQISGSSNWFDPLDLIHWCLKAAIYWKELIHKGQP